MKAACLLPIVLAACPAFSAAGLDADSRPAFDPKDGAALAVPGSVLAERRGVKITHGGFGSAMARDPRDPNVVYLLTDRGPNVAAAAADVKLFPVPEFTPCIGVFELGEKGLTRRSVIELRGADGRKLGGSP